MPHPPDEPADDTGEGPVQGPPRPPSPTDVGDYGDIAQNIIDEEHLRAEANVGPTTTTSKSTSSTSGSTISKQFSVTEQISRRFFDVPTEEQFLNNFETAYGGFLQTMRDQGLGTSQIALALDPASGIMDILMGEYMGDLAQRAEAGENIFELVGTEEDFDLIRTEPGGESITKGGSESQSKSSTTGGSSSQSTKEGGQVDEAGDTLSSVPGKEVTGKSSGSSASGSTSSSKGTSESKFSETIEILSRPQISAVFKNSPNDFLAAKFEGDEGALATFIESRKGERQRQRQTLAGGPIVQARRS